MDLKKLIAEIDYQSSYSYEKRAELFNKYAIPTHMKFFNPIYELCKFIIDKRGYSKSTTSDFEHFSEGGFSCYSHSGAVASKFNSEFNTNHNINKSPYVKFFATGRIIIYGYDRHLTSDNKFRSLVVFEADKTITIKHVGFGYSFNIPRNLYDLIDEWLIDFGYEKW